jgi:predicted ester cyclase
MSIETNKATIRRYLDALRADKSPATLDLYIAEENLKQHIAFADSAFPGYVIEPEDLIAEGDRVFLRGAVRGVHKGDFMGLAPTGREINVQLFIVYRLEGDKIVDHWMLMDTQALMQQLGAVPEPVA